MDVESFIDSQLALWEVPGCAVAVVHGDGVVLNRGFGTRRLGADAPVSSRTLFPIGSATKSFTAAGVGALVDEGLVDWDRPVRDYISGFAMHDPVATERITVADLLAHRSGIPRHEFVWLGHPERTRADIVARLRYLAPSKDIRQAFQYSNLGYMTVGHLVEVLTGGSWESFTESSLLKPLGMERTNFSIDEVRRSDEYSTPHERRGGTIVEIPFRPFDQAGPAGSINSCADDMVAWLRANLGRLPAGTPEVISSRTRAHIHQPQTPIPEDRTSPESTRFAYGLGWVIGQYRGHRIVEHSGGVDGFLTDCMLLPDDDIGVVVLTNCWSGMGPAISFRVFDELLGLDPIGWSARLKERLDAAQSAAAKTRAERPRVPGAVLPRALDSYVGDYEDPGYGTISIAAEGDRLIPAFGTLDLSLTHRHYDVFDLEWHELVNQEIVFPLTFLTAPDGSVNALEIPFEEEVAPIRFERRAGRSA
jgi:CubicO group peptidase (beta-lactamase class C family)